MTRTVITSLIPCLGTGLVVFALVISCADSTKYRMLTFFFDGVPEPGQARLAVPTEVGTAGEGEATARAEPPARYVAHPPYRDNQCARCHDPQGGQLLATIEEGLCLVCHAKVAAEPKYLHGPVAVNDCGVCHHYHESRYPSLLLTDPATSGLCLDCHDRDDLTTPAPGPGQAGDHHADLERRTCIECHHPHGGSDKFFLKRTGP